MAETMSSSGLCTGSSGSSAAGRDVPDTTNGVSTNFCTPRTIEGSSRRYTSTTQSIMLARVTLKFLSRIMRSPYSSSTVVLNGRLTQTSWNYSIGMHPPGINNGVLPMSFSRQSTVSDRWAGKRSMIMQVDIPGLTLRVESHFRKADCVIPPLLVIPAAARLRPLWSKQKDGGLMFLNP